MSADPKDIASVEALRERVAELEKLAIDDQSGKSWRSIVLNSEFQDGEVDRIASDYLNRTEAAEAHATELARELEATRATLLYYLPASKLGSAALASTPAQALERHKALENCAVVLRCYAKNKIGDVIKGALERLDALTPETKA
ncbi:hypothetical protein LCGC14_2078850 [marine sediment metagenome]|uniref:Uncharacterized protein n=1 Tax=marine sediment metagenome TaxID=412755 RepID=A0A0F9EGE5_9ZZZZ